jgi:hypothetical protein
MRALKKKFEQSLSARLHWRAGSRAPRRSGAAAYANPSRCIRRFSGNTTPPNLTTSKAVCSPLSGIAPHAGDYSLVNSS